MAVDLAREVGICESCYGFGYMEAGLQIEVVAKIMNFYPPTLEIIEMKPSDPAVGACVSYKSDSPTASPTNEPSANPTQFPTVSPTEVNTTWAPSFTPTSGPTR